MHTEARFELEEYETEGDLFEQKLNLTQKNLRLKTLSLLYNLVEAEAEGKLTSKAAVELKKAAWKYIKT